MSARVTRLQSLNRLAAAVFAIALVGCSNQWREADLGITAADVLDEMQMIKNEVMAASSGNVAMQTFFALLENPGSSFYYGDAPGPLGPVASVFSVVNYTAWGQYLQNRFVDELESVRVVFVDLPGGSGQDCALLVDVTFADGSGSASHFFQCTAASVTKGEYVADLVNSIGSTIRLRSFDVDDDGQLKGVIQMKVYELDAAGNEHYNGKFSTLVGFSP